MSHFAVAVFHKKNQSIDDLLAPYDEQLPVEKEIDLTYQAAVEYVRKYYSEFSDKEDYDCWEFISRGYDKDMIDSEGNLYVAYNPDGKWDWWQIGGRFKNKLRLKATGKNVDSAQIKKIDFKPSEERIKKAAEHWNKVENNQLEWENPEYYLERYKTREQFFACSLPFHTFAVVTSDGTWYQKGKMGW